MKIIPALAIAFLLGGCAWDIYKNDSGHTALRPKYPAGTPIYYEDGTYSSDMRYNQYRPVLRAVDDAQVNP